MRSTKQIIIGLTGPNGAGKGEVANFLKSKGFAYYSLSDVIRDEATKRNLEHSRENLRIIGNELRESFGPSVLGKLTLEKIENQKVSRAVVDSIRNPEEIKQLKTNHAFFLLGVTSKIETRFERAMKRNRNENALNLEEFKKARKF